MTTLTVGAWLREAIGQTGLSPSAVYREYIRRGGQKTEKTFTRWLLNESSIRVDDVYRLVLTLDALIPERDVPTDFMDFLFESVREEFGKLTLRELEAS